PEHTEVEVPCLGRSTELRRPRRPGAGGAQACVRGPRAPSPPPRPRRGDPSWNAPRRATPSLAPAVEVANLSPISEPRHLESAAVLSVGIPCYNEEQAPPGPASRPLAKPGSTGRPAPSTSSSDTSTARRPPTSSSWSTTAASTAP